MEEHLQPRIRAIIGLGNPGRDYEGTRHNLGFNVVEALAGDNRFVAGTGSYFFCEKTMVSEKIVLLKPTTYMNRSGLAVARFAEKSDLKPEELLVIADDFNIPMGRLRLRTGGSDGGHNGLSSIIYQLSSDNFPRIRLGIGPVPESTPAMEFVLERFSESDLPVVRDMVSRAADAVVTWIEQGFDVAAGRFNRPIDEN